MAYAETFCRWRFYDEATGKFFSTNYWTTDTLIRIDHPDAVPIPGTEHVVALSGDPRGERGRFDLHESGNNQGQ